MTTTIARCLYCGEPVNPAGDLLHLTRCDGRQGRVEAAEAFPAATTPDFDGETYVPARDHARLCHQLTRVLRVMRDHRWRTLADIARETGDPLPSISARLRDLRKEKFGGHTVERRYIDDGLWEYQMTDDVSSAELEHLAAVDPAPKQASEPPC